MKTLKTTGLITSTLLSAVLLASPLAMAGQHGDRQGHHGNICEKMDSEDWQQKREQMREKYSERHETMAERLQLTEEQRKIWDEIRDERRQEHQQRMASLRERCAQKETD